MPPGGSCLKRGSALLWQGLRRSGPCLPAPPGGSCFRRGEGKQHTSRPLSPRYLGTGFLLLSLCPGDEGGHGDLLHLCTHTHTSTCIDTTLQHVHLYLWGVKAVCSVEGLSWWLFLLGFWFGLGSVRPNTGLQPKKGFPSGFSCSGPSQRATG